jgi:IclR family KDG regulon transcriptional repressor
MKPGSKYGPKEIDLVNSLSRGLLILELLTQSPFRLSQSKIQELTDIPKATLYRILRTLTELQYLRCDPESKKYSLHPKVLILGLSILENLEVREIARPYIEKLSREFNRSVSLLMQDGAEMVFIERVKVPMLRDFNVGIGSRIPIYITAPGRAVLANLNREKLQEVVSRLNKKDPLAAPYLRNNCEKLYNSLVEVRNQGYAINDEESQKGLRGIAAPIFSPEGVIYALSISVPPEEVSVDKLRSKYAPRLVAVSKEISGAIGHRETDAPPQILRRPSRRGA